MQSQRACQNSVERVAHSPDCKAGATPGHLNSKGRGASAPKPLAGAHQNILGPCCSFLLGGQRWVVSPAAIPAGAVSCLYVVRKGCQLVIMKIQNSWKETREHPSLTEKGQRFQAPGRRCGGVPRASGVQEYQPLPPQLKDHSIFCFCKYYTIFILIYPVCVHIC